MPVWLAIALGMYAGIAAFVTLLARLVDNPYGHATTVQAWRQALVIGVLWLPGLVWVVAALGVDWFQERFRD